MFVPILKNYEKKNYSDLPHISTSDIKGVIKIIENHRKWFFYLYNLLNYKKISINHRQAIK